jgi:hypothetical protein
MMATINSTTFPSVALRRPPSVWPTRNEISSVPYEIKAASGKIDKNEVKKTTNAVLDADLSKAK